MKEEDVRVRSGDTRQPEPRSRLPSADLSSLRTNHQMNLKTPWRILYESKLSPVLALRRQLERGEGNG